MKNYVILMRKKQADGCGVLREWMISADNPTELSARINERATSQNETPYAMFYLEDFIKGTQRVHSL